MFSLTQQERRVILFLVAVALAGAGINFLAKRYSPVKTFVFMHQNMGKVDLNAADKEALIDIPGIGEKIARRIIVYRKEQGGFRETEELKKIKGITDYRYEKIKDLLYVD